MSIETRIKKLENQAPATFQHRIVVQFESPDEKPGPLNMVSCHGEVFTRKTDEPHDAFIRRATGDAQGVVILYAIADKRPPKHPLANSIYLAGNA